MRHVGETAQVCECVIVKNASDSILDLFLFLC